MQDATGPVESAEVELIREVPEDPFCLERHAVRIARGKASTNTVNHTAVQVAKPQSNIADAVITVIIHSPADPANKKPVLGVLRRALIGSKATNKKVRSR